MKIDINTWASECDYDTECTIYEENKGGLRGLVSPYSPPLFVFISHSLSLLLPFLSRSPHLPTFFVRKCLLNKLTVLWRVISKAKWRSMLMLNLFCIHFALKGTFCSAIMELFFAQLIRAQSTHLIPFICCWKHARLGLFSLCSSIPVFFFLLFVCFLFFFFPLPFVKVVIIFQGAVIRILGSSRVQKHSRVTSGANSVHKSHSQGLSAFH